MPYNFIMFALCKTESLLLQDSSDLGRFFRLVKAKWALSLWEWCVWCSKRSSLCLLLYTEYFCTFGLWPNTCLRAKEWDLWQTADPMPLPPPFSLSLMRCACVITHSVCLRLGAVQRGTESGNPSLSEHFQINFMSLSGSAYLQIKLDRRLFHSAHFLLWDCDKPGAQSVNMTLVI